MLTLSKAAYPVLTPALTLLVCPCGMQKRTRTCNLIRNSLYVPPQPETTALCRVLAVSCLLIMCHGPPPTSKRLPLLPAAVSSSSPPPGGTGVQRLPYLTHYSIEGHLPKMLWHHILRPSITTTAANTQLNGGMFSGSGSFFCTFSSRNTSTVAKFWACEEENKRRLSSEQEFWFSLPICQCFWDSSLHIFNVSIHSKGVG